MKVYQVTLVQHETFQGCVKDANEVLFAMAKSGKEVIKVEFREERFPTSHGSVASVRVVGEIHYFQNAVRKEEPDRLFGGVRQWYELV